MGAVQNIPRDEGQTTDEDTDERQAATPSLPAETRRVERLRQRQSRGFARRASTVGTVVLIIVVVAALLLLVLGAFARGGRAVGGYRALVVLSGSMTPKMPVGSVVVSKSANPMSIKVGDIITFVRTASNSTENNSAFVTHRVVRIVNDAGGLSFVTKGDANNTTDQNPVLASHVVGRVVLVVPWLGHVTNFVRGFWGWLLLIIFPAAIIIVWEIVGLVRGTKKRTEAAKVLALTLCLFGATQLAFTSPASAGSTSAYFSTEATWTAEIQTGFWQYLSCEPGKAKAVRHGRKPSAASIASADAKGKLSLDFGEIPPGNCNNSPDVFKFTNEAKVTQTVRVSAQGEFAAFVDSIEVGKGGSTQRLAAGEQESVTIKLNVPTGTASGDYAGTVTVRADDGSTLIQIRALVTVRDDSKGFDQTITPTVPTLAPAGLGNETTSTSTFTTEPVASTDTTAAPTTTSTTAPKETTTAVSPN